MDKKSYTAECRRIAQKNIPKPFMCNCICTARHLLCYKFHHWFWPVQIDSAVTVSNEPSTGKGGREGGETEVASTLVAVEIQIWKAHLVTVFIRLCSQYLTKQENIYSEKSTGYLIWLQQLWLADARRTLPGKGSDIFSPEPLLSKLIPSHLFYFFYLMYGQMSTLPEQQNMELSFPRA